MRVRGGLPDPTGRERERMRGMRRVSVEAMDVQCRKMAVRLQQMRCDNAEVGKRCGVAMGGTLSTACTDVLVKFNSG